MERVSMATTACSPYSVLLRFGFLHVVVSAMASMATAVPPVRVAAIVITILAAFRLSAIIVLCRSASKRQTPKTENQQQTKNYDCL
jgi:hypothetical protein